jgi:hypothetical protein
MPVHAARAPATVVKYVMRCASALVRIERESRIAVRLSSTVLTIS